ncbi:sensor domain-containing diguanylate cyclase [Ferrimonas marina]|uniref:diguanylate cyclase n=1 Tax=Ferrimonas marina TaxID=299255 RepID=A0A1M5X597_9GAMM|nr:diguanylate cyclase [Ferrimonas marina]SHH94995.1 diguanylate cyclase (GGDEF) domain-containing protein [Ferrimonas marina]
MDDLDRLHWLTQLLHGIEVGLVVIDRDYRVQLWNGFMENHSGIGAQQADQANLFSLFPELPDQWLKGKLEAAFLLESRAFTVWEQRPWVFPFSNSRPVTGELAQMHQNMTIQPLKDRNGLVSHAAIVLYDVSVQAQDRQQLSQANDSLARLSHQDTLTGLANRRLWHSLLEREFARCRRYQRDTTLLVLDLDHFKRINDHYGHSVGDAVLRQVGGMLGYQLRKGDVVARYGGEEFVMLLTETPHRNAQELADRLRQQLPTLRFDDAPDLSITGSIGICPYHPSLNSPEHWFELADQALYRAKRAGRDRILLADLPTETPV